MKANGFGYDIVLFAASQASGFLPLAKKINPGKAKLLFIAFNLVLCSKDRINFEVNPGQNKL